MDIRQY
jgi:hypothetical protein